MEVQIYDGRTEKSNREDEATGKGLCCHRTEPLHIGKYGEIVLQEKETEWDGRTEGSLCAHNGWQAFLPVLRKRSGTDAGEKGKTFLF